jgi:hypothetical protein
LRIEGATTSTARRAGSADATGKRSRRSVELKEARLMTERLVDQTAKQGRPEEKPGGRRRRMVSPGGWGVGFRVWSVGVGVCGVGCKSLGIGVKGVGFRV